MTETDLTTLLREHVHRDEPPLHSSPDAAILAGRRVLRRHRRLRGGIGVLVAATVAAIAVPLLTSDEGTGPGSDVRLDPATREALADYDATAMPEVLSDTIDPVVKRWAPGLLGGDFAARDSQGESIPKRYWHRASSMDVTYELGEHTFRTILLHARSEAEGDARESCQEDVASGYKFSCEVSTAGDGDTVTTSVIALRRVDLAGGGDPDAWGAVSREELRTGKVLPGDPSQRPIDPAEIYFQRSVESVHSDTFLTSSIERVKAPDLAHANAAWQLPVSALIAIVTDPALVIPEPPVDDKSGCDWAWKADVTCGID